MNACTILNGTLAWDVTGTRDCSKCLDIDPEMLYGLENVSEKIAIRSCRHAMAAIIHDNRMHAERAFYRCIDKTQYNKTELCAQTRASSLAGGMPVW